MVRLTAGFIVLLVILDSASPFANNTEIEARNEQQNRETRRKAKKKKSMSTSSSKSAKDGTDSSTETSLDLTTSSSSTSKESSKNRFKYHDAPKSSAERKGWRKWHRKCTPCPEDMRKKWRDPTISWICGAYQRARRSFKSLCMMHYRNCEDGTMFVKIHEHRCDNSTTINNHGDHFFYDYKAWLSVDTSHSSISDSSSAESTS